MTTVDWPEVRLGDVIDIKHGFAFKGEHFADSGQQIVVTPGNFYDEGGFKLKEPEKYYTGAVPPDFILEPGDVLVVMTEQKRGLLGSAGLIPSTGTFLHNQRLGRVVERDLGTVSRRFLYYAFNSPVVRGQIQATANGAKVRHTSPTRIKEVTIRLPPLEDQQKISAVLAAYDELIENNLRRIEILEGMAKAIYREWFINFRYPGHDDDELVDSPLGPIPAEWKATVVSGAFEIVGGATPSTKKPEFWDGGTINWFTPSDLTGHKHMVISESSRKISQKGFDGCSARLFPAGSVMMTSRATLGVVAINAEPACTNQGFITCLPNERVSAEQIYFWIRHNVDHIIGHASGATFKEISKRVFKTLPFTIAPAHITEAFVERTRPTVRLIGSLVQQNANLRATRDLLLPKLVSGEIDVSDLEIDTSWLAA